MDVVKKQHYVSQEHLRSFVNMRERLYVFDKDNRRSFVSTVRDVANTKYFYDFGLDVIKEVIAHIDAHPEFGITSEQRRQFLDPQLV